MSISLEWDALVRVIVVGLLVGAGLPALFALGIRLLSPQAGSGGPTGTAGTGAAVTERVSVLRLVGAITCFAVVAGAVVIGIVFIVLGGH